MKSYEFQKAIGYESAFVNASICTDIKYYYVSLYLYIFYYSILHILLLILYFTYVFAKYIILKYKVANYTHPIWLET